MKKQIQDPVSKLISEQMRKAALALSPEQRKANGVKSWETRRANLAKTIKANKI